MISTHIELEDRSECEETRKVDAGSRWHNPKTGKHDRYVDISPGRKRESFGEIIEGDGGDSAYEKEERHRVVKSALAE